MKLRWTNPALRDLEEIHAYIAERDPAAALRTERLLRAQAESLTAHPLMGRAGRIDGTRELVVAGLPFAIAYRVTEASVDVLAIRHGARVAGADGRIGAGISAGGNTSSAFLFQAGS